MADTSLTFMRHSTGYWDSALYAARRVPRPSPCFFTPIACQPPASARNERSTQCILQTKTPPGGGVSSCGRSTESLLRCSRRLVEAAALEQRLDVRRATAEVGEQRHRVLAAALGEQRLAEVVA